MRVSIEEIISSYKDNGLTFNSAIYTAGEDKKCCPLGALAYGRNIKQKTSYWASGEFGYDYMRDFSGGIFAKRAEPDLKEKTGYSEGFKDAIKVYDALVEAGIIADG